MNSIKNIKIRNFTLGLHIVAMILYFISPMFIGGNVSVFWLALGVLNTMIFCILFYRDSGKRVALSIFLFILSILWCMALFVFVGFMVIMGMGVSLSAIFIIYLFCTFFSATFALAQPRRGVKTLP